MSCVVLIKHKSLSLNSEAAADKWYDKYREVSKKLEELEKQSDESDEEYITTSMICTMWGI